MTDTPALPTVYPWLRYRDARRAIDWLTAAFGFTTHMVVAGDDGRIDHAQLAAGSGMVMLGTADDDEPVGGAGHGVYVVVADPDAHHARAVEAGAEIVFPLTDQDYGSREYTARDPEGCLWSFGTYQPSAEAASD